MHHATLPRSYLYVPGDSTEKLAKALTRGADALIIDLEDSVPLEAKSEVRLRVRAWLESVGEDSTTEIWVRINSGDLRWEDLGALYSVRALTGVVLAKSEASEEVALCSQQLSYLGDETTLLMPLLETAAAILDARRIASQPRVRQLQIGEVDLAADVGLTPDSNCAELAWARAQVVFASAAARIGPPVGAVSVVFDDDRGLTESTLRMMRSGFMGRACIHPRQVAVVNSAFAPSAEDVSNARDVLRAFEAAQGRGLAVATDSAGRMIDPAVIRNAEHTLRMATRGGHLE
jgi:citrate lyase subunit beta/citryl-CoA lyase